MNVQELTKRIAELHADVQLLQCQLENLNIPPNDATYITVTNDPNLTNERVITESNGITITDNGPNNTIEIENTATLCSTGGDISLVVSKEPDYLIKGLTCGPGIILTDQGTFVEIETTVPVDIEYLVLSNDPSIPCARQFLGGLGININDTGPGGTFTISSTATLSSTGGESLVVSGIPDYTIKGLSAGPGITITNQGTNLKIESDVTPSNATYITATNNPNLSDERVLTGGPGITITDNGPNNTMVVENTALLSSCGGSSLVKSGVADYTIKGLTGGSRISIIENANNLKIASTAVDLSGSSFLTISNEANLSNERRITSGLGISFIDNGSNNTFVIENSAMLFSAGGTSLVNNTEPDYLIKGLTAGNEISIVDNGTNLEINSTAAPSTASYITINNEGSLTNERSLSGGLGIVLIDNGSNSNLVIENSAMLFSAGGTSLVIDTEPDYLIKGLTSGPGILISSNTNDLQISSTLSGSSFITVNNEGSLTNERALTSGTGISIVDGGPNGPITINNTSPATSVTLTSAGGTESLVNDGMGESLATKGLTAGTGISLSSDASSVTITSTTGAPVNAEYVVVSLDGTLTDERNLTAGSGISIIDGGANNSIMVVNTDGASTVTLTSAGGTETLVNDGMGATLATKGLTAGAGISLTGAPTNVTIENSTVNAEYVVVSLDGTLTDERNLTAGSGISIIDGGANNSIMVVNTDGASTVTLASAGGTETLVVDGGGPSLTNKGLTAGTGISLTGGGTDVTIANTGAPVNAEYVVVSLDGTLTDERNLTAGSGISIIDGGANNSIMVVNSDPGSGVTLVDAQAKVGIIKGLSVDGTGPSLSIRTLTQGSGITLTETANDIEIINSVTLATTGTGNTLVNDGSVATGHIIKGLSAGTGISLTNNMDDIVINNTGAPFNAEYVVMSLDGTLTDERVLTVGDGLSLNDAGANSNVTLTNTLTLSTTGTGDTLVNDGSVATGHIIKGLTAGTAISLINNADDIVIVNAGPPLGAEYVVMSLDGTLTDERVLTVGDGLSLNDAGAGSNVTLTNTLTLSTTGTGNTLVNDGSVATGHIIKGLTAGTAITLTNNADDIVINTTALVSAQNVGTTTGTHTGEVFDIISGGDTVDIRRLDSVGTSTGPVSSTLAQYNILQDTDTVNDVIEFRNLNNLSGTGETIIGGIATDSTVLFRRINVSDGITSIIDGNGNILMGINPLRSIPLSFRFNESNGDPTGTSSTTFGKIGSFTMRGTAVGDNIDEIKAIVSGSQAGVGTQIQLFDYFNNIEIARSGSFTAPDAFFRGIIDVYVFKAIEVANIITVTNGTTGTRFDVPGAGSTAPFSFAISVQGIDGLDGAPPTIGIREVSTIDTTGATPASVDGTWFAVYFGSEAENYYFFWYDTDNSGTAQPANPLASNFTTEIVEIDTILTGDTAAIIATKTATAMDTSTFTLSSTFAVIDILVRKTNGGGGSAELHALQLYG